MFLLPSFPLLFPQSFLGVGLPAYFSSYSPFLREHVLQCFFPLYIGVLSSIITGFSNTFSDDVRAFKMPCKQQMQRLQYEFSFGIDIMKFSIYFFAIIILKQVKEFHLRFGTRNSYDDWFAAWIKTTVKRQPYTSQMRYSVAFRLFRWIP